ncbi:ATP-grasp domain-containing protein [Microbacterium sp. P5_E9]
MDRTTLLREVDARLKGRSLVWAGLRGDDVEPLVDVPQLRGAFSIMSRYSRRESVRATAYEDLTGVRIDPETWDIDEHLDTEATREFRRDLLRALAGESALVPYRPSQFLSAISFARRDDCLNLGMFGAHQSAFEHKPWVETSIAAEGVPHIPWHYVADEEQLSATTFATAGQLMLRRSRTSGGEGLVRVPEGGDLRDYWPDVPEAFVSVSRFIEGALPVNVGATVWRNGEVTVHHPSVQLIGIRGLVTREFGYCGNDFGRTRDIDVSTIDQIEDSTTRIGRWLHRNGYLGSFGVDFLVHEGKALFTEVNPRFQGSTHASCRLSIEAGEACLMLEHLAAWLKLEPPKVRRPLRELVAETPDLAHIVVHWGGEDTADLDLRTFGDQLRATDSRGIVELLPPEGLTVAHAAAVARWTTRSRVTDTGYELRDQFSSLSTALSGGVRTFEPEELPA